MPPHSTSEYLQSLDQLIGAGNGQTALVGTDAGGFVAGGPRGWAVVGRSAVAVLVGAVVGELAAVVMFSGSINQRIDAQAARVADSTPAASAVSADLDRTRQARTVLDDAVDQARIHRDQALVVARCEFNPTPGCPQTRITGVPGSGPETRTANQLLADTQRELDNAVAAHDRQAPRLDAAIATSEKTLTQARQDAVADADRGLGARWVAMHDHTLASAGALVLWAITIAFFALLSLLPLILNWLRGETTHDRGAAARAERDRAELDADTAIAVKRAEVRATIETMWAEQQLANARFAIEAQNEIDRELHRRRVDDALYGEEERRSITAQAEPTLAIEPRPGKNLPARLDDAPLTLPNVTRAARPVDSPAGAAVRRPRDRHDDAATADRASSLRGSRGDHLRVQAHTQGDGRLRGDRRVDTADRVRCH